MRNRSGRSLSVCLLLVSVSGGSAYAGTLTFGTEDCLTLGCYGASNPTSGATLSGLSAGTVTLATSSYGHGYPFSPAAGDFAGTDQIYVGSTQTASDDGYSTASNRLAGPDVMTLDYSSLVAAGQTVTSITLGIAADDFQFPVFGNSFVVTVDGSPNAALSAELNSLNLTGPTVQFFTIGLNPAIDNPGHVLTLSINEGGNGGDGYAVDFLTLGVTTSGTTATPEPSTFFLMFGLLLSAGACLTFSRGRAIRQQ